MLLMIFLLLLITVEVHADSREVFSANSPLWLEAVGKLNVPGQKWENADSFSYEEHCSATLIGGGKRRESRYILSAWHCLEYYDDLSKPITFSLPSSGITREAYVVASGGGMSADWALLKLHRPVPRKLVQPFPAYSTTAGDATLTMAGYSSDSDLGQGGAVLTYDARCQMLRATNSHVTTDCSAYKGASGGPVVAQSGNTVQLLGVISAGDSDTLSLYAPVHLFAASLRLYLSPLEY